NGGCECLAHAARHSSRDLPYPRPDPPFEEQSRAERMESTQDLKRVLAEEIRAAIADTAPAGAPAGPSPRDPASSQARSALSRAEEVLTPAVPDEAPLAAVKRLAIRAMRFLWRNQSSFNALTLTASSGLADGLDRLRAETSRGLDELARRAGIQ